MMRLVVGWEGTGHGLTGGWLVCDADAGGFLAPAASLATWTGLPEQRVVDAADV